MNSLDDLGERVCGANFIVGQHQGDQGGVRAQCRGQLCKVYVAVGINCEPGDLEAVHTLQEAQGFEHCFMFCSGRNDVLAPRVS